MVRGWNKGRQTDPIKGRMPGLTEGRLRLEDPLNRKKKKISKKIVVDDDHKPLNLGEGKTSSLRTNRQKLLLLEGVGKEIWQGVDAKRYVGKLRNEWGR